MKYLVSFDLMTPGKNYENLTKALSDLGGKRVLYSQWILPRLNTTAAALRDHVRQFMDANDRVFVNTLDGTGWAGINLLVKPDSV